MKGNDFKAGESMSSDLLGQVGRGLIANAPFCKLECCVGCAAARYSDKIYLKHPVGNTDAVVDNGLRR